MSEGIVIYPWGSHQCPFPSTTLAGSPHLPSTAIESQVSFHSFCKHAPIGVSVQSCSGYVAFRYFPPHTRGETYSGRIGFITILNTFAIGVGSLEIIQFVVDRSNDPMFSNRRVQGVESAQLVLTLAGSICGCWL